MPTILLVANLTLTRQLALAANGHIGLKSRCGPRAAAIVAVMAAAMIEVTALAMASVTALLSAVVTNNEIQVDFAYQVVL